jgi:hypothetical protein
MARENLILTEEQLQALVNLLIEPDRFFPLINLFNISCLPAMLSVHVKPIPSAVVRQHFPIMEFLLIKFSFLVIRQLNKNIA